LQVAGIIVKFWQALRRKNEISKFRQFQNALLSVLLFLTVDGIACGLYDRGYVLRYPAGTKEPAFIQRVQTCSKTHQSSYTGGAGGCFPEKEVIRTRRLQIAPYIQSRDQASYPVCL